MWAGMGKAGCWEFVWIERPAVSSLSLSQVHEARDWSKIAVPGYCEYSIQETFSKHKLCARNQQEVSPLSHQMGVVNSSYDKGRDPENNTTE